MFRRVISMTMFLIGILFVSAQTPLPLNPKVKKGVLPNGLTYYIMHNEEPKERANFYIAQKVGSSLEEENQLGLAHFLEHMAFNGTKNYPGKSMLNYLQGKGIRFGADINAYTNFDETVYNINNVPTSDRPLVDSVLLVLRDWSCDLLLEEDEINAERGVIQEEWRQRNNAQIRLYTQMLPKIYEEYQYHQMPIGKMEVVMNFEPEALRSYYKKWYRPDQQGIIIVGDIDADEMEKKVKEMFSSIEMPENAAERVYPQVSNNKEPIYFAYTDPELTSPRTVVSFKQDKIPFEYRNTVEAYAGHDLVQQIVTGLINRRLEDNGLNPDCKYSGAGVYFGDFYVSKTKSSFNIVTIPKKGTQGAVAEVMGIVARACKTGFTESELDRVRTEILANIEKLYNEREKTDNGRYGSELCTLFINNEPAPGIEKEFEIMKTVLPLLPVTEINKFAESLLTSDNMVIVTSEPQKDGFEIVAEDVLVKTVKDAMEAEYEVMVDDVITEPLISKLPKKGKIVKKEENKPLGIVTYTLSNGAKVVVKSTDFSADEILMTAYSNGGKCSFKESQAANVKMLRTAFGSSKFGPFDYKSLTKYLAGKKVDVAFNTTLTSNIVGGESTVKDLPTFMELLYTTFTALNPDPATYDVAKENYAQRLKNAFQNPQMIFSMRVSDVRFGGNKLLTGLTPEEVENASYPEMLQMLHSIMGNAADFTFIFTGNIDEAVFLPLVEQYIASLPSKKKKTDVKAESAGVVAPGIIVDEFKQPMQIPSTSVFDLYHGHNLEMNVKNYVLVAMLGDILDNLYIETLREEEGGTYGASVNGFLNFPEKTWNLAYSFQTNADQQASLIKRAQTELDKLLNEGADQANFTKVKEAMLKQYEINSRKNSYWDNGLLDYLRGFDVVSSYRSTIEGITLEEFNSFAKNLYDGKNRIEVIMEGVAVEK